MKEETIIRLINELDHTEEMFFVSKSEDGYRCIAEINNHDDWIDVLEDFLNDLKKENRSLKGEESAIEDLLNDNDMTKN